MRRKVWALLAACGLVVSLLTAPAAAQDDDNVVVRIGLHAAEKNLNPFITPQALPITHDFTMLVYDTLFWSQATLDPEPWLATGAEASDDFRTWTVTLRDDVTWHDGEAFTADDVAFTFDYFATIAGPGRYGHHVYDHPVFESAEVIDETTVALTFADPVGSFTLLPGGDLPILPQHIWEGIEDPRADATSLPVGTGPFRMVDYQPGESYRLEANADYFKGAPLVDELVMPVVADAQAGFAALQAGELDFVTRNVPTPLMEPIEGNPDVEIITGSRMQSQYLMFNVRKPILNDPTVRKAMSMALDLDAFVATIEGGQARPGNDTWTHPDSPWAHPNGGHEYDPEAAATMLDEAGYPVGDDGVRAADDGTPLAFTLLVNAAAPPQVRSGELIAEQLAEIGVDITVEPLDAPAISAARRPPEEGGPPPVDMFVAVFESHAHADPDHLFFFFHTPGRGVGGVFSGYANPEFDAILEDALDEAVDDKVSLINEAQEIFAAEVPAVTLYYPDGRWGYRPAAYNGWIADPGHGVFTKRSFLADYANPEEAAVEEPAEPEPEEPADEPADEPDETADDDAAADEDATSEITTDDGGLGTGGVIAIGAAALALIGGGLFLARRRADGGGGGDTVTD